MSIKDIKYPIEANFTDEDMGFLRKLEATDMWWDKVLSAHNIAVIKHEVVDTLVIDDYSNKFLNEKIEKYEAQDVFKNIERIVVRRFGHSVFEFYRRVK